jgi:threonine synthase
MFADEPFRERLQLGAVNSINWARVMAQVPYYAWAALQLGAPHRTVGFSVPTGNFGNVLAGWAATQMGLPIGRLVVGSNTNDILTRWLATGAMTIDGVVPTLSPSMDIQVSSNVERLLFELNGRDGGMTADQLRGFRATGRLMSEPDQMAVVGARFSGARVDDTATLDIIRSTYATTGELLDPHTAVGLGAVDAVAAPFGPHEPVVVLATAHPAKFPDAVERATGVRPELPPHLGDLFRRTERTGRVANDLAAVEALVDTLVAR